MQAQQAHQLACVSSASFLYIVVLCQFQLVELSRFQYYLNCDCMFDLFNCIEVYSCKAQLFLSQLTSEPCLWPIELYSSCCEVKNSLINLLHSMSRDLLQHWIKKTNANKLKKLIINSFNDLEMFFKNMHEFNDY